MSTSTSTSTSFTRALLDHWAHRFRAISYDSAITIGLVGSIIIALCSHAVGAPRIRGGIMHLLGLTSFTSGHMQGILTVVFWIAIALLIVSWISVGGHMWRDGAPLRRRAVASWVIPFLFAGPMMSRDVYSYLMQGTLARDGIDAYTHGAAANPGPMLFEVSADWRNTTTPYGPLHLWIGELITRVTGDNITAGVLAFKLLSLASVAVMVWAVARLAEHMGARADLAVWIGVLNPLCLIHLLGGMHNENLMMALVLTGYVVALTWKPVPGLVAGAALIAVGTALKATAIIALPFLVWITVARIAGSLPAPGALRQRAVVDTGRRLLTLVWTGVLAVVVTVAVMAAITAASGQSWGWVTQVTGNTKVINPLALPSFLASTAQVLLSPFETGLTFNVIVDALRPISTAIMLVGLVVVWWLFRHDPLRAIQGVTLAYMVTCVFNTVTLPWYYAAALAFVGLWVREARGLYVVAVFVMWLSMMFDGGGNNRLYTLWWVLLMLVVMGWLAAAAFVTKPWPERGASLRGQGGRAGRPLGDREASRRR
ncbi:alpha-(1-_6)-mannopyranosyltransferase A [Corynebacterium sp. 320]|uniref:Alpha-(1->6)-mannopyranosyltransferase A n=1 Tax=Corynebacterium zhongnanshanii TaxID=2768834 RepID=A0ABQ6VDG6_9CORY|nr:MULTISPECIES: alpha-(1->6)-mannopyranosyltransferase A [Corynebacterium]KAB1502488.1 alpha-(1->6)-mannopyranosyltransferase A [Corynebacterium sp. 320]KAB1551291.1 alpha-(1->6)-mannopyranosyltransferase A [Corynebacterium sp. 321]KAB1551881.1 alpha-(1->6)-mannopyranosyltransferase A [Corynebacterium sp. 319]KAB3520831.1 alpha-(1->6)-mannopyranosyltransferase A [Corynebacterium zhongnanshanii]KAB3526095.1 alpha-(1->6)-mannopyranosyltransferase A [Corynebacterium sp. 250]